jgi:small-conductance mechanosensitive channel/CRP-like cAMP-binding protein
MSFWEELQKTAGVSGAYLWFAVFFFALVFVLGGFVPRRRAHLRNSALLFSLSIAGLFISTSVLYYGGNPNSIAYRWTQWATWLVAGIAIIGVVRILLFDVILQAVRLDIPRIIQEMLTALAYIVLAIFLLSRVGVNVTGIVATSAVLTAVIGLSLQDTLINFMGGMALELDNTINVGDWIRVDKYEGRVKEIRWRQTSIETRDWDTVVIPNSMLIKGQVVILGKFTNSPRQHRMWVYFNVDFRYSPNDVIETVEKALRAEPIQNVAQTPQIHCLIIDFKDSFATYAVRYWLTDIALTDPTNSVVRSRIYTALKRAGVSLSIPAQSIFITEDDASRRGRKKEEEIATRAKVLREVEIFKPLTDEELLKLAERLSVAPFVRGEAMVRQGTEAHWLYVITEGEADVRVSADGAGLSKCVATLSAGDFFGEMGMMTGERRAATVIAKTDVECYRIDKNSFQDILHQRPEIAEGISQVLAHRRVDLDAAREGLNEEARLQREKRTQSDLLRRIKDFFTM